MKTKLLKKLRAEAKLHYGVFRNGYGLYDVVHDRDLICPDLSKYEEGSTDYGPDRFEVVTTSYSLEEAKAQCDECRRNFILRMARQKRYGNKQRYY